MGRLRVFTERAVGVVPVTVERVASEPAAVDAAPWWVRVERVVGEGGDELAALVYAADLDSADPDGSTGADHYHVVVWAARGGVQPGNVVVYRPVLHARRTPVLSLERCAELAASAELHARLHALPELARHGGAEALARLDAVADAGDELERASVVGALSVGLPICVARLARYAVDADERVRRAVLPVVHRAMLDYEFERAATLDVDAAYAVLGRYAADGSRSLQDQASGLLTELDALVNP
nr:hypothetical protein [Kofleriaceae bacterium]